jgi:hypothetical protein
MPSNLDPYNVAGLEGQRGLRNQAGARGEDGSIWTDIGAEKACNELLEAPPELPYTGLASPGKDAASLDLEVNGQRVGIAARRRCHWA